MNRYQLMFVAALLFSSSIYAQTLPGPAQAQQIRRYMDNPVVTPEGPSTTSNVEVFKDQAPSLSSTAQKAKFKLNKIILTGNKVFSTETLSKIYQHDLHKEITVGRLLQIVQEITDYYRAHGYISSKAMLPVQAAEKGTVHIIIVEGTVDRVSVTGSPKKSKSLVERYGHKIATCQPLELKCLEKYLLLANEIPATIVHGILKASENTPGASDLILDTQHQNVTGYITYDNYRTRYIGPQQITGHLEWNSFLMSGDNGQVTFAKTPKGQELTFFNANYNAAMNAEGDRWLIGGTRTNTHPLFVLQPFDVNGTDRNYYTVLSFPHIRTLTENLTYLVSFNYENATATSFSDKLYTDQLRSLGVGVLYNMTDRTQAVNSFYVDLRQGLPIFGYTTNTAATALTSRPGGHAVYTKLDLQASRLQPLFYNLSLYGLLKGQYGFQALLTEEQFAFGGPELGRGYDIAEMLGDRALTGTLEARYDWNINRGFLSAMQFYAFYDFGKMWNFFLPNGIPPNQSATSTGLGVRFFFTKYISGNIMWTQPLTKQVAAEELIGNGRKPRTFFSLVASI